MNFNDPSLPSCKRLPLIRARWRKI
jgi:predicted nuclease with RNAse H fold